MPDPIDDCEPQHVTCASEPFGGGATLRLGSVSLTTGEVVDVDLCGDRIDAIGTPGTPAPGDRLDLPGYLLVPAPSEPHAHLDKALTATDIANPGGDLPGAIEAWRRFGPTMRRADIVRRATSAALLTLAHGATAIRSHVDVFSGVGLRGLEALLEVRHALRHQVDIQLAALVDVPLTGIAGAQNRALLRAAAEVGADAIGTYPYPDPDPEACHRVCLQVASDFGLPVDLHTDETTDPTVLHLQYFADLVARTGFPYGATASHCVSLGTQAPDVAARVSEQVAAAGVAVICLPQTNLLLQARDHAGAPPRGLTAVRELLAAGVTVGAGGDNLQDPFNPLGRGDPLETASLLVAAAHLTPEQAYTAVSSGGRAAIGLPHGRVEVGAPAELLAIRASTLSEAVATATADRVVIHRGRVVSRTSVTREFQLDTNSLGTAHAASPRSWA